MAVILPENGKTILDPKKLKSLIPYIGPLFIMSGYFKLNMYYQHFNIQISDYLEITEILTLFLNDALIYSGFVIVVLLFHFFTNTEYSVSSDETFRVKLLNTESTRERFKIFLKLNILLVLQLLFYLLFLLTSYFLNLNNLYLMKAAVFFMSSLLATNYLKTEFSRKYKITYGIEVNATYLNLAVIISLFFTYAITSTFLDIRKTEEKNKTIISFNYDEKEVKSNSKIVYLGVTKNHLFLFDKKIKYLQYTLDKKLRNCKFKIKNYR